MDGSGKEYIIIRTVNTLQALLSSTHTHSRAAELKGPQESLPYRSDMMFPHSATTVECCVAV